MHEPSAAELLYAWERGQSQQTVERALTLLALALPDVAPADLARLSIGQRDGWLLALRERVFGPRLASVAACPACGERVELDFSASDVRAAPPAQAAESLMLAQDGYDVRFRLPSSLDLVALAEAGNAHDPARALLLRCVERASYADAPFAAEYLPDAVVDAVATQMAAADPQADIELALQCPNCGWQWNEIFDIGAFLWAEIDAWAARILRDIHTLALHYGWQEADILAMSAWRRQIYLGLLGG